MKLYYEDSSAGIRIYHGDCVDENAIEYWSSWARVPNAGVGTSLCNTPPAVMITDPPYGMRFKSNMEGAFKEERVVGDEDTLVRDSVLALWGDRPALVFGRWSVPKPYKTRMVLIWEKGEHVGMGDLELPWKPNTEEIYVLGSGFSGHRSSCVLRVNAVAGLETGRGTRYHPTQKPVGLMHHLLAKCPDGPVLDPFMGSGTTLRAAKNFGRSAIGIEIEERYCEAAARRLQQEVLFVGD